jgi:hypothetical protein
MTFSVGIRSSKRFAGFGGSGLRTPTGLFGALGSSFMHYPFAWLVPEFLIWTERSQTRLAGRSPGLRVHWPATGLRGSVGFPAGAKDILRGHAANDRSSVRGLVLRPLWSQNEATGLVLVGAGARRTSSLRPYLLSFRGEYCLFIAQTGTFRCFSAGLVYGAWNLVSE